MIGGFRVYIHNWEWVIEPAIYFNTVLFLNAKKRSGWKMFVSFVRMGGAF